MLLLYDKGWWHEFYVPGIDVFITIQRVGSVMTFIWIVWLINAYNFMDGIDGIAGFKPWRPPAVGWLSAG